jgi:hypothetical protein
MHGNVQKSTSTHSCSTLPLQHGYAAGSHVAVSVQLGGTPAGGGDGGFGGGGFGGGAQGPLSVTSVVTA